MARSFRLTLIGEIESPNPGGLNAELYDKAASPGARVFTKRVVEFGDEQIGTDELVPHINEFLEGLGLDGDLFSSGSVD